MGVEFPDFDREKRSGNGLGRCPGVLENCSGAAAKKRVERSTGAHAGEVQYLCRACAAVVLRVHESALPENGPQGVV